MATKKRSKTSISLALDRVEREICLELANHKSMLSGETEKLQWCHIVKRGRKALRWDRRNHLILTASEHWVMDNYMTDRQRYRFVRGLRPDDNIYDHLDEQIKLAFDLSLEQMLLLLEAKKAELKEIKNGSK